ncbi:MAG: 1-deoxy-D-xylulose-5-phosphate reductoisomerase [Candidatus Omnitrophica bacterium]|nr:1-deoxy-D-xylulose-5-phosphate reductoisomerase [Candidatus Omnitrophota bacterium]
MKRVAVLGSTGSIGQQTLEVIASHPQRLSLVGLAAHSRIDLLEQQIARHHPSLVGVVDEAKAAQLAQRASHVNVLAGVEGLITLVTDPRVDVVVVGTSGREALTPLVKAIEAGKRIALASKELLVMAGSLITRLTRAHQTILIPVDSEHAALFQLLRGIPREEIAGIGVTGSGGPLWSFDATQLQQVPVQTVLRHPKWQMGPKITVDSATLMNKGLEVIEAHWLFDMPFDRIRVLIHPQAQVHAVVELVDGTVLTQMSACDMRLPIQYALSFPERWPARWPGVQLLRQSPLTFCEPDLERFPCLRLALEAARRGDSACAVLSAANEVAVRAYLDEELAFGEIARVIEETLAQHQAASMQTFDDILVVDAWARQTAQHISAGCRMQGAGCETGPPHSALRTPHRFL